jgi:hypothetical protein
MDPCFRRDDIWDVVATVGHTTIRMRPYSGNTREYLI